MAWVERLAIRNLRSIHEATIELHPGLNVFHGRNAQGKTSLLEAVGVVARVLDNPLLDRRLRAGSNSHEPLVPPEFEGFQRNRILRY